MTAPVAFTRVRLPGGWMGNMSPYPVVYRGVRCRTGEHLFQALRFDPELRSDLARAVLEPASPTAAKFVAKRLVGEGRSRVEPRGEIDLANMALVVRLKLGQHPDLQLLLQETGDASLIEDTSGRARRDTFWGAARLGTTGLLEAPHWTDSVGAPWVGHNHLGRLWEAERSSRRLL